MGLSNLECGDLSPLSLSRQCWRPVASLPIADKSAHSNCSLIRKNDSDSERANSPESMTTSPAAAGYVYARNLKTYQENQTMKKTVLIFGLISGVIMAALMFGTLPFTDSAWLQSHSMFIGYTTMVFSFMLVFFRIRSYRENIGGGTPTFGRGLALRTLISPLSSALSVRPLGVPYFVLPSFSGRFR